MHDLSVVVVSHGHARFLPACLAAVRTACAGLRTEIVVVENGDAEAVRALGLEAGGVRVLEVPNEGFGAGNDRGADATDGRHVLFLNPDTEVREGRIADLVARLDEDRALGALGAHQVGEDGGLQPSIRRFPSPVRAWAEALGGDRLGLGERVVDPDAYRTPRTCDWTTGSFLLVRRAAFRAVGGFDEGFFLFSEETDLCRRLRDAGWEVAYDPRVVVVHHHPPAAAEPRTVVELTRSRRRYARKHLGPVARRAYLAGVGAGLALRGAAVPGARGRAARAGLRELIGGRP